MADLPEPIPAKTYSFFDAMIKAVTSPSQATYSSLAQDPYTTPGKAFLWVGIASAISSFIGIVLFQIFPRNPVIDLFNQYGSGYWDMPVRTNGFGIVISLICGIPIGIVVSVIAFAILVGLLHLVAKMMGGSGDYGKLAYMLALIFVPFTLINSILAPIPWVGCISFLITIYMFVLQVLAINAVYEFGIAKAVVTLIIPLVVLCLIVVCLVVGLGAALVAIFSNSTSNFPQGLPIP